MSAVGPPPGGGTAEGAAYADRFAVETPEMVDARARAAHLTGPPPVEPAVGATLAVLASSISARSVVSIGSGGGLAGLWLMRGMRPDGVLTALDGDPEQLRATRKAFADAGIPAGRARMIFGTPAEVLPRLSSGAYDMVVCAGPPREYSDHLPALLDLVRVGGTLTCHGLLEARPRRRPHGARPADGRLAGDHAARSARTRRCCPPSCRSATDSWSPPSAAERPVWPPDLTCGRDRGASHTSGGPARAHRAVR